MTLLIAVFAAIIATVLWYKKVPDNSMKLGMLALMYWGAALMWLVDAIVEYIEVGAEYFTPPLEDMLNGLYLGLAAVALGLIVWLVVLIIKDPKGIIREGKLLGTKYDT